MFMTFSVFTIFVPTLYNSFVRIKYKESGHIDRSLQLIV